MASRQPITSLSKSLWRNARPAIRPVRAQVNACRHYSVPSAARRRPSSWQPYLALSAGAVFIGGLAYSTTHRTPTKLDAPSLVHLDQATKQAGPVTDASPMRLRMEQMIKEKQKEIVAELGRIDGKPFIVDEWTRDDGTGGGISC
ncbi:Coproporphyrinogen-III oxidase, partial [Ascosphaera pollenicola]